MPEMREGREGGSTGCGGDAVTGVGMYEERAGVGSGVTCEYTVGGVAVLAAPAGGGGSSADNGWLVDEE